jgi:hypothetical protein
VSAPPRVLLACVAEDTARFHTRVETLVRSARALGGSLAGAPIVVTMVDSAQPSFAARMRMLDTEVRVVPRRGDAQPAHANKLAMLDLCGRPGVELLLALDCDVALARDPRELLREDAITAAAADLDPLGERRWRALCQALGLPDPELCLTATATGKPMCAYFNSGVMAIPSELGKPLGRAWEQALQDVRVLWARAPWIVPRSRRFYADQLALAVALARGLPWACATPELNFPTHLPLHEPAVQRLDPALLHYHAEADRDGLIFRPRSRAARPGADRVNRVLAGAPDSYRGLRPRPLASRSRLAVRRQLSRARAYGRDLPDEMTHLPAGSWAGVWAHRRPPATGS